ncbi:YjbF family lipoprotein [Symbiopectobacterium sp. RP]|uniref:YjbF family lipoprotein n=1 Tax=Symbiopectobacterium sp. RP TaxID=3248553 RepID=UPI003D2918F0
MLVAKLRVLVLLPLFALALIGCSQKMDAFQKIATLAIWGLGNVQVSAEKVAQTPYASAYLRVGKAPQAFVVLAFAENGQFKWIGADRNIVVTQNGRLVKTQGFGEDIAHVINVTPDPLAVGLLKPSTSLHWQGKMAWSQVQRGDYAVESVFQARGKETVTILDKPHQLLKFTEQVSIPVLNAEYTNTYWLEPTTGQVVQTWQQMGPDMALIKFTVLKPYVQ